MTTIILGSQFGDEGKGKFVDIRCATAQVCARFAGGNNAGHTIVANGITYDFHAIPSGLVNPRCINLIGTGCVLHIPSFFQELSVLEKKGLDTKERIFISDRAHITFDLHQIIDGLEEEELGGSAVGTTKKGIGPTYSAKAARSNPRISDVFHKEILEKKLRALRRSAEKRYGDLFTRKQYDLEGEIARFDDFRERLKPFVIDAIPFITELPHETDLLVEGANALMNISVRYVRVLLQTSFVLGCIYGGPRGLRKASASPTYLAPPNLLQKRIADFELLSSSSNTGLGSAIGSLCLDPAQIKEVIGCVKSYTTRVGSGPLPTEQLNEDGDRLQTLGKEYGVTTGRRRRCGWLDLVIVKHSHAVNHYRALNLTKLDVLDTFPEIPVATAYRADGKVLEHFPADLELLSRVEVVYTTMPGWMQATTGITKWEDLPENAQRYVTFIDDYMRDQRKQGPICKYIGTGKISFRVKQKFLVLNAHAKTGPNREDIIIR